jgi:hypothetical protein
MTYPITITTAAPMPMTEAMRQLELANNGYTFALYMNAEFIRQADRLVARGKVSKVLMQGVAGDMIAYALPSAVKTFNLKVVK